MNTYEQRLQRRQVLAAIGLGGFVLGLPALGLGEETTRGRTPPMTRGPFYPQIKPLDQDADLTVVAGGKGRAQGQLVDVAGRVVDLEGRPIAGAKVGIWQADARGHYHHPDDRHAGEADANFQGFGVQTTDAQGRYRFRTVKPGPYPLMAGMRTPHIHFEVEGPGDRVVTQMFFPGEALNAQDRLLQALPEAQRQFVIARRMPATGDTASGALLMGWDVVMLSG